jgi:glucose-6-phosphate 1-dehydrogenase
MLNPKTTTTHHERPRRHPSTSSGPQSQTPRCTSTDSGSRSQTTEPLRQADGPQNELLDGEVALSVRADEAEKCWRIIQPVREAWAAGAVPLEEYPAGSTGPGDWATS